MEARRRAREAGRRANEKRAAREKALIKHSENLIVHLSEISQVEQWKRDRLAQLRAQVADEAARRLAERRAAAGAEVAAMHRLGETLAAIAERSGGAIGVVRTLLRHAPKAGEGSAGAGSGALGEAGDDEAACGAADDAADDDRPDAASA